MFSSKHRHRGLVGIVDEQLEGVGKTGLANTRIPEDKDHTSLDVGCQSRLDHCIYEIVDA